MQQSRPCRRGCIAFIILLNLADFSPACAPQRGKGQMHGDASDSQSKPGGLLTNRSGVQSREDMAAEGPLTCEPWVAHCRELDLIRMNHTGRMEITDLCGRELHWSGHPTTLAATAKWTKQMAQTLWISGMGWSSGALLMLALLSMTKKQHWPRGGIRDLTVTPCLPNLSGTWPIPIIRQRQAYGSLASSDQNDRLRCKIRGDGNCFWRSIGGKRWKAVKRAVARHLPLYAPQLSAWEQQQAAQGMKKNAWNNEVLLRLTAHCLQLNLDIYTPVRGAHRWRRSYSIRGSRQEGHAVKLAYARHHHDRLRGGAASFGLAKEAEEIIRNTGFGGARPSYQVPRAPKATRREPQDTCDACQKPEKMASGQGKKVKRQKPSRRKKGTHPNPDSCCCCCAAACFDGDGGSGAAVETSPLQREPVSVGAQSVNRSWPGQRCAHLELHGEDNRHTAPTQTPHPSTTQEPGRTE